MNQIEQLIADIRNKLTPFWVLSNAHMVMYDKALDICKAELDPNKESIINSLEQIVELSQSTTGKSISKEQIYKEAKNYRKLHKEDLTKIESGLLYCGFVDGAEWYKQQQSTTGV